jgi:hypothetical protein
VILDYLARETGRFEGRTEQERWHAREWLSWEADHITAVARVRHSARALLLVILPAAVTAADLCMGRGHCAQEEQQRYRQPTPRETCPCGVAW